MEYYLLKNNYVGSNIAGINIHTLICVDIYIGNKIFISMSTEICINIKVG